MESGKVSVIMPAYNAERFIEKAIRSVIAQTYENWELLVIDDCSSDGTLEIAKKLAKEDERIKVLKNEQNMGVARTRNRGLDMCGGDYIALLDSDDIWLPEKTEQQLKKMQEKEAVFSYSSYSIIDAFGEKTKADYIVPEKIDFEGLLKENIFCCSSMLFSAAVVENIRFNHEFYHEDYIFGLQILEKGYKAVGCEEVLLNWRYIENSRSFNKIKSAKNRWKIYRDFLEFPLPKSFWYFMNYALAGIRKYK